MISGWVAYMPTRLPVPVFWTKFIYHTPFPHNILSSVVLFHHNRIAGLSRYGHDHCRGGEFAAGSNHSHPVALLCPCCSLSGATFPARDHARWWVQSHCQFSPRPLTLFQGMKAILLGGESALSAAESPFGLSSSSHGHGEYRFSSASKLFRWEKEEKISGKAKLWILVVLAPFFISLRLYQARTKQSDRTRKADGPRSKRACAPSYFNNVNIFVGNGEVDSKGGSAFSSRTERSRKYFASPLMTPNL